MNANDKIKDSELQLEEALIERVRKINLSEKAVIEAIVNISEGRRIDVIDKVALAVKEGQASLIDVTSDYSHNRTVLTFMSDPIKITRSIIRLIKAATEEIDLNFHEGVHPRIGAVDVVPLVPIKGVTYEECVKLANVIGQFIGDVLKIPVYLYEKAAKDKNRTNLASFRNMGFEKLRAQLIKLHGGEKASYDVIASCSEKASYEDHESHGDRESCSESKVRTSANSQDDMVQTQYLTENHISYMPDYGPRLLHETAGAIALGVRKPLIAFNVNLGTDDVHIAKEIAGIIREKNGGMPGVKALGLEVKLKEGTSIRKVAQVSMNIVDYHKSSLYQIVNKIKILAHERNTEIYNTEIIGLCPMELVGEYFRQSLKLKGYNGNRTIIEWNLL